MRTIEKAVKAISTAKLIIELAEGQYFCKTKGAWEIWQETPELCRVKRIPRSKVFWVFEKENEHYIDLTTK